jgi:hypothetical protein
MLPVMDWGQYIDGAGESDQKQKLLDLDEQDYEDEQEIEVIKSSIYMTQAWLFFACLGLVLAGVALAFAIAGFAVAGSPNNTTICNRGSNTGTNLAGCPITSDIPGFALVSADVGDPSTVFVSRISRGNGTTVTYFPNTHIEVGALVESLNDGIIVDVSPDPERAITLELNFSAIPPPLPDLVEGPGIQIDFIGDSVKVTSLLTSMSPAITVIYAGDGNPIRLGLDCSATNGSSTCNITCFENYYMHLVNGDLGYGMALGYNHTFPDTNDHGASGILSGSTNTLLTSNASTIAGGTLNRIEDTRCSFIGAGMQNVVIGPKSGILIGEWNQVEAMHSVIGAGIYNLIGGTITTNSAIVSGANNTIQNAYNCLVGTGNQNTITKSGISMETVNNSAIIAGDSNQIVDCIGGIIGSGNGNLLNNSDYSAIVSGSVSSISNSSNSFLGSAYAVNIANSTNSYVGAGLNSALTGSSSAAIVTGLLNLIQDSNRSFIGSGESNSILASADSFLGAGFDCNITRSPQCGIVSGVGNLVQDAYNSLIGAGYGNTIKNTALTTNNSAIVVGQNNQVLDSVGSIVGAGSGNLVNRSDNSAIVSTISSTISLSTGSFTGSGSTLIHTSSTYSFLGAGSGSSITSSTSCAVVAGSGNSISSSTASFIGSGSVCSIVSASTNAFIGAGSNVSISASSQSGIVAGANNTIRTASDYSGILAGYQNLISNSTAAVILVGRANTISNGFVTSATFGGNLIGAGYNNTIQTVNVLDTGSAVTWNAILAGSGNDLVDGCQSFFIGAGNTNYGTWSRTSAIVAGNFNSLIGTKTSASSGMFVGAGVGNSISYTSHSYIGAGSGNSIATSGGTGNYNFIGSGASNSISTSSGQDQYNAIVAGNLNSIRVNSSNVFIGSGISNLVNTSNASAIVAGNANRISSTGTTGIQYSFIGGGNGNIISLAVGGNSQFIGAGLGNLILGTTGTNIGTAIVAGNANQISRTSASPPNYAFIGAGNSNIVNSTLSANVAGSLNIVSTNGGICFVGAGTTNVITNTFVGTIVGGSTNTISGSGSRDFIGAGTSNTVTATLDNNAIVSGNLNTISSTTSNGFIGSGQSNSIASSPLVFIGAGSTNSINGFSGSPNLAIVAGSTNTILATTSGGSNNFIGAGFSNMMNFSLSSAIVAGSGNLAVSSSSTIRNYRFVGAGTGNIIVDSTQSAIVSGNGNRISGTSISSSFIGGGASHSITAANCAIVSGNTNSIAASGGFIGAGGTLSISVFATNSAIVAGATNSINGITSAFIAAGAGHSITGSGFGGVSILSGSTGIAVSGNTNANTGFMQSAAVMQTFRTYGFTTITTGTTAVVLGQHIFLTNTTAAATLRLGTSSSIPDGMHILIRDIGDLSVFSLTVNCATSACTLCPLGSACTASSNQVLSTTGGSWHFIFQASGNLWYEVV